MVNCKEWSVEFDQAFNNIASNQAPGLTEYDKSRVLTKAQENVVLMLCNGTLKVSFEETEESTKFLASLVRQVKCTSPELGQTIPRISNKSVIYALPNDLLFRTLEICVITSSCGDKEAIVTPITQDEYWRTTRDPFKKQNENKVLRLSHSYIKNDFSVCQDYSEIISDYPVKSYFVRYIKRPEPIVLVDLANGLSINGRNTKQTCLLDEALHQSILAEAVRLAKAEWVA